MSTDKAMVTGMVDAAMVEMSNIHPPLKRSECERLIHAALSAAKREAGENWQIEYEVVMKDGDFCASSTDLNDAMHYAAMYSADGPVEVIEVRRRAVEASHE